MSLWGALAGGFVGTLVLTTALRTANELGLTRVDLPFLLGTAFTGDRARAKALGYLLHLLAGEVFALIYYAIFAAIDTSGWLARSLVRAPPRRRVGHRAGEHPAPGRPSPHGQYPQRRRQRAAARAAGVPDAQLRSRHPDRHRRSPTSRMARSSAGSPRSPPDGESLGGGWALMPIATASSAQRPSRQCHQ